MTLTIGWIGLGTMGGPMAGHLLRAAAHRAGLQPQRQRAPNAGSSTTEQPVRRFRCRRRNSAPTSCSPASATTMRSARSRSPPPSRT
jgi:hypothetical protein